MTVFWVLTGTLALLATVLIAIEVWAGLHDRRARARTLAERDASELTRPLGNVHVLRKEER